jgi:hypothetical protein
MDLEDINGNENISSIFKAKEKRGGTLFDFLYFG